MKEPVLNDELSVLTRLKQGDGRAFTAIYNQYWQQLFFAAYKRLQSADDAKEIVQEVFLTLWQKREQLEITALPLYLSAMVRYAVYRHLANQKRAEKQTAALQAGQAGAAVQPFDIDNRQFLDILHNLANTLPEKYRIVFVNHKLLDQPLEEVAAQLGISPRTAEDYVSRIMKIMRKSREKLAYTIFFVLF
ncbi:MAG TPA: sigma-70 family RNA polymerase sigma factor [Chitinophagaceae bacterium]|nr:sigma-70 family RNA polymerase sigma factor [Chitinophagaceae bacterium]